VLRMRVRLDGGVLGGRLFRVFVVWFEIGGKLRGRGWEEKWMCVLLWGVTMAVVGFVVAGGSGDGYVNGRRMR